MPPIFSEELWLNLKERLKRSTFRAKFKLKGKELIYAKTKGLATLRQHATDFVGKRLAPPIPVNDGKQTPMKGHPVFIAQHATGTCCRACLHKWHNIPENKSLTPDEQQYIIAIIVKWIEEQIV
jgi:exodeoxyribonuclease V alpha subunit